MRFGDFLLIVATGGLIQTARCDSSESDAPLKIEVVAGGQRDVRNATRDAERALARTLSVIGTKTATGRLVLLVCKQLCPHRRRQIPQWIRQFNEESEYVYGDTVAYHYYLLRRMLPILNTTDTDDQEPLSYPAMVYLIGNEKVIYPGDLSDKDGVLNWLRALDSPRIHKPTDAEELDSFLTGGNCSERYLLYSPSPGCELDHWKTIARAVYLRTNITTVYLPRPRDIDTSVVFFRRLPLLREEQCLIISLVHLNFYSLPFKTTTPAQVLDRVQQLTTEDECVMMDDEEMHPVVPPLSELQMEFYTGERRLYELEESRVYVVVGSVGGLSVIALAISIFWGLNGSAFTNIK